MQKIEEVSIWGNNIDRLDTAFFTGLKKLKSFVDNSQHTFKNGKPVSMEEFQQLLKHLTNKDIRVSYFDVIGYHQFIIF